jgi:hypothetical protein
LNRDCPEVEKEEEKTQHCYNSSFRNGERLHLFTCRGYSRVEEKMLQIKVQKAISTGNAGPMFATRHVTPGWPFAAAQRENVQQQHQLLLATTTTVVARSQNAEQQETSQQVSQFRLPLFT